MSQKGMKSLVRKKSLLKIQYYLLRVINFRAPQHQKPKLFNRWARSRPQTSPSTPLSSNRIKANYNSRVMQTITPTLILTGLTRAQCTKKMQIMQIFQIRRWILVCFKIHPTTKQKLVLKRLAESCWKTPKGAKPPLKHSKGRRLRPWMACTNLTRTEFARSEIIHARAKLPHFPAIILSSKNSRSNFGKAWPLIVLTATLHQTKTWTRATIWTRI